MRDVKVQTFRYNMRDFTERAILDRVVYKGINIVVIDRRQFPAQSPCHSEGILNLWWILKSHKQDMLIIIDQI